MALQRIPNLSFEYSMRLSTGGGTRTLTLLALVPKTSVSTIPPHLRIKALLCKKTGIEPVT